ncbi:MAG: peptide deformylase [Chloroflexi bacterium]|nr:peptide deformylase [Chloroflexota bacterium]
MSIREILTTPHPVLRGKAKKITQFDDELNALINDMIETMRDAPGVGLAATQVNAPLRIFVAEFGDENDADAPLRLYTFVNPKITKTSRETVSGVEGCLSVPGIVGEVIRPHAVTVTGFDRDGNPITVAAEGWLARIFQHEIDHLNGVLYTDHALSVWESEGEVSQVSSAA